MTEKVEVIERNYGREAAGRAKLAVETVEIKKEDIVKLKTLLDNFLDAHRCGRVTNIGDVHYVAGFLEGLE